MTQFILEQGPQITSNEFRRRTDIFYIPERGYIKMMFLKITVSVSEATLYKPTLTCFEFHDQITLDSFDVPFCFDNHVYAPCRVSQLSYDNYRQISDASTFKDTLTTKQSAVRPLFFSAYDNGNRLLATDGLSVKAILKPNFSSMGFNIDKVTGIDVRLKIVYEQEKEYVWRPLKNTYNARSYASVSLLSGATDYQLKLKCPFNVISLMFMIKRNSYPMSLYKINSVNLSFPNGEYGLYENNTDFSLTSTGSMEHNDSTYIISFGSRTNTEFIKINKDKNPTIAAINFLPVGTDTQLHYIIEYHSTLEKDNERIIELIEDSTK